MAEAAPSSRGLARLRGALGGGHAGGSGHDPMPASPASPGRASGAVEDLTPAENIDEGESSEARAITKSTGLMVRIESAEDRSRAKFLEEVFFEYAAASKRKGQRQEPPSSPSGSPPASPGSASSSSMAPGSLSAAMFDDFLRGSGLKCSNMRQVNRLIEMMREAKRLSQEGDEGGAEGPSEADVADI
jgi:hypothetical protein